MHVVRSGRSHWSDDTEIDPGDVEAVKRKFRNTWAIVKASKQEWAYDTQGPLWYSGAPSASQNERLVLLDIEESLGDSVWEADRSLITWCPAGHGGE